MVERANRTYDRSDFVELVALATGRDQSLAVASKIHPGIPDSDTFHLHLKAATPTDVFTTFQARLDELLSLARVLHWLDQAVDVAIDRHNEPNYGAEQSYMVGMERKAGTNKAHAYLTSQRLGEPRLTLDLQLLNALRDQHGALADLLKQTLGRNPNLRSLLLDKGFYTLQDIQLLLETGKDFIVPIPKTKALHNVERDLYRTRQRVGVTARFIASRRYRMGEAGTGPEIVQVIRWEPDPEEPTGEGWFAYACRRETTVNEFDEWATRYRTRWGIETGYRTLELFRRRTTSHRYSNRLYLTLIAVLLDVAWRLVRHARRRRGRSTFSLPQFLLDTQPEPVTATA
ncbi:MAG: transposase [Euryarchaeota archaeon]|nr:transposase [Euryarchaeota archaeon]